MSGPTNKSAVMTRASSASVTDTSVPAWAVSLQQEIRAIHVKLDTVTDVIEVKIKSLLEPIQTENSKLNDKVSDLTQQVSDQQHQINSLRVKCKSTTDRLIKLEAYSMRENIIISGIPEIRGENDQSLRTTLCTIFSEDMEIDMSDINIVRCHRLGNPNRSNKKAGPRDVIVRFATQSNKMYVLSSARKLKGRETPIYINEQFPKEIEQRRRILRPALRAAKDQDVRASMVQDRLLVKGRSYSVDNLSAIPLCIHNIGTTQTEDLLLFHGRYSPYSSFFSRPGLITDDNGDVYCSAEQFYQRAKALHTGNKSIAMEIMSESDSAIIKQLGSSISGDISSWGDIAPTIMEDAIRRKFSQNLDLANRMKEDLLEDGSTRSHIECNKYDKYWGIGLAITDPDAKSPDKWQGENMLGKILDRVRDDLILSE